MLADRSRCFSPHRHASAAPLSVLGAVRAAGAVDRARIRRTRWTLRSSTRTRPPTHWLGVDHLGRDMLVAPVVGCAHRADSRACSRCLGAAVLGTLLGLFAGYRAARRHVIMRVGDTLLAFPKIILYLIIIARFGASAFNIIAVITVTQAPIIARIVRAVTLDVKNRDYVAAARLRGESTLSILLVEILPNARGPLIVDFFLRLGYTVIAIGVLGLPRRRPAAARPRLGRHDQGDIWHDLRLAAYDPDPGGRRLLARHRLQFPGHWPARGVAR